MYQQTYQQVKDLCGHDILYFDSPIHVNGRRYWAVQARHGGTLWIRSEEDQWCRVELQDTLLVEKLHAHMTAIWENINRPVPSFAALMMQELDRIRRTNRK